VTASSQGRERLARMVTELLAPAPIVTVLLLVVAWHSAPTLAQGVGAGLMAALFASLLPFLFILQGVRRGRWTDHHVAIREQRPVPLLAGVASVLVGLVVLLAWDAPRDLVALLVAMLVGLVASLLVTLRWKVSIHTAVAAGGVVVLALVFGPALLVLAPLVGLISWARVAVGDHSPAQVALGAALGAAIAATVFSLLR
jgi:membrane-associated phospholipid phosphatase